MLTLGYRGPLLVEDANDLSDIAELNGTMPPRSVWVDEIREEIRYRALMSI